MAKCFSLAASRDSCFRYSFGRAGLKSTTTDLGDGTVVHCWVPKSHRDAKPTLLLVHGFGANAMWQWNALITPLSSKFNLYVPDLVFFGDSHTSLPDRSATFQARSLMRTMEVLGVRRMSVAGLSYGGIVAYYMAAQFPEAVDRVVLGCAGVSMEEKDMDEGMFQVSSVEEATAFLLPKTPEKMRELLRVTFYKSPRNVPSCFLNDFIEVPVSISNFTFPMVLVFDNDK